MQAGVRDLPWLGGVGLGKSRREGGLLIAFVRYISFGGYRNPHNSSESQSQHQGSALAALAEHIARMEQKNMAKVIYTPHLSHGV